MKKKSWTGWVKKDWFNSSGFRYANYDRHRHSKKQYFYLPLIYEKFFKLVDGRSRPKIKIKITVEEMK